MTLALVTLAPTHWKQNINKNKNRIQAHNKILLQPLPRRRDKGTGETLLFAQGQMMTGEWTITEKGMPWSEHCA